ncbi:helix-turn-helix transcriptional regulator [Bosea sp. CS1GBMeth4]|uniref:helix-turn-helix domain-containing protein n=1 Tax=Bosea sp. CS1GBMeth4 TaxID=1892849 RepID=UPI0016477739|nr:helix-turn-helix transcriptional regulator [Bosea sp. CS1GBMeth4]
MTPEQCRAARGFLDWSQSDLAGAANVSNSTVRDYEAGRRVPIANNLAAIEAAFRAKGVSVSSDGGALSVTLSPQAAN